MKRIYPAIISLISVLLVAGCGGSSSSGSNVPAVPTTPVQITSSNAETVARSVAASTQSVTEASAASEIVTGVVAQPSGHLHSPKDIAISAFALARGMHFVTPEGVSGVVYSQTVPCDASGSMTFSLNDANNNSILDAGEPLTVRFSSCNDGYSTQNGSLSFAVTALGGTTTITAAFTVTFTNFSDMDNASGEKASINGDITFSISTDGTTLTGTMSGASLAMSSTVGGSFKLTDYSISLSDSGTSYSYTYNMTIAGTLMNGSVTITTSPAFTGTTGDPTAGEMVVTGANGSTLTITARSDGTHVGLTVDDDGAAGPHPPETLADVTWADLN